MTGALIKAGDQTRRVHARATSADSSTPRSFSILILLIKKLFVVAYPTVYAM